MDSLWDIVARNVRRLRITLGLSQEELTDLLGRYGLNWAPTAVPSLEAGKRQLDLGELVLVCAALDARPVDLLEGEGVVELAGSTEARLDRLRAILAGDRPKLRPGEQDFRPSDPAQSVVDALAEEPDPRWGTWWSQLKGYAGSAEDPRCRFHIQASLATGGSAERHAAPVLGVRPIDVSVASYGLWGQSLTKQREAVLGSGGKQAVPSRTLQARRGRVTRLLIQELRRHMALTEQSPSTQPVKKERHRGKH